MLRSRLAAAGRFLRGELRAHPRFAILLIVQLLSLWWLSGRISDVDYSVADVQSSADSSASACEAAQSSADDAKSEADDVKSAVDELEINCGR